MLFGQYIYFFVLALEDVGIKQRHSRTARTAVQRIPENAEMVPASIMPNTAKKLIAQTIPLITLSVRMRFLSAWVSTLSEREEINLEIVCFLVLEIYALL